MHRNVLMIFCEPPNFQGGAEQTAIDEENHLIAIANQEALTDAVLDANSRAALAAGGALAAVPVGGIGVFVDNGRDTTLTDVTLGGITGPINAAVPDTVGRTISVSLLTNTILFGLENDTNFFVPQSSNPSVQELQSGSALPKQD